MLIVNVQVVSRIVFLFSKNKYTKYYVQDIEEKGGYLNILFKLQSTIPSRLNRVFLISKIKLKGVIV